MTNRIHDDHAQAAEIPKIVGTYDFCPLGCHPADKRDFRVSLLSNGTLVWDDATKRAQEIGGEAALLDMILTHKKLRTEDDSYIVRTPATPGVVTMINRIETIILAKKKLFATTVKPLDRHLDEIFWPEVNPQLNEPVRPRTYG